MAIEIALRPPFTLPRVFWAQDKEPRQDFHWVGHKPKTKLGETGQDGQNNNQRSRKDKSRYQSLSRITHGEVDAAFKVFEPQLIPAHENWLGKNYFCTIHLQRVKDGWPRMIFGRVNTCYPSDGHIDNIEDMEILFPGAHGNPKIFLVHKEDISRYSQLRAQSFYVRVRFKASAEDATDFKKSDRLFASNGFIPEFNSDYYDLLEMNDQNQAAYPWLYVIGSRWFDSIPASMHIEIRAKLEKMLYWGKHIINYHPDWLPKEINPLNKILGYKYGFTHTILTEPANPQETALIVSKIFDQSFIK